MPFPSKLLSQLSKHNISVFLDKSGSLKVRLPTDDPMSLPEEVKELLRQLKASKEQIQEYLAYLNSGDNLFVLADVRKQIFAGADPLDFRFDVEKQQWILDSGWWLKIPKNNLH